MRPRHDTLSWANIQFSLYNGFMNIFAALSDPARCRLVEVLARGERPAGYLTAVAAEEFGLSQPATSRHLRILREAGVVRSRVDGARRLYAIEPAAIQQVDVWVAQFRSLWVSTFAALEVEVASDQLTDDDPADTTAIDMNDGTRT